MWNVLYLLLGDKKKMEDDQVCPVYDHGHLILIKSTIVQWQWEFDWLNSAFSSSDAWEWKKWEKKTLNF